MNNLQKVYGELHRVVELNLEDDSFMDWYRKTSGMHTIEGWCTKYQKHPYCWGALLMIHGVEEVTQRLRNKVESYAVYS